MMCFAGHNVFISRSDDGRSKIPRRGFGKGLKDPTVTPEADRNTDTNLPESTEDTMMLMAVAWTLVTLSSQF